MIPKIIHYCWFGPKEKSPDFKKYLESWKRNCPDYEIREWNETNFDASQYLYSREAYGMNCYAHVSDVCRIHALHECGGVYLDTDVEVLKSFDEFLKYQSFVGTEFKYVGAGVIGAEAGAPWLADYLDYYRNRHFINPFGHPRRKANTEIITELILPSIDANRWPTIFPKDYFCGKNWNTGTVEVTPNTVAIHHYEASWRGKRTFKQRLSILANGIKNRYFK